jgi:hypothetical protein
MRVDEEGAGSTIFLPLSVRPTREGDGRRDATTRETRRARTRRQSYHRVMIDCARAGGRATRDARAMATADRRPRPRVRRLERFVSLPAASRETTTSGMTDTPRDGHAHAAVRAFAEELLDFEAREELALRA